MLTVARGGQTVVRLEPDDLTFLGPTEEERELLAQHGIPWELVPSLSSSNAARAAAGLAFPWRETGSFAVVRPQSPDGEWIVDYPKADNLLILVVVPAIKKVVKDLLAQGWPADTPTALILRPTLPWERTIRAPLSEIPGRTSHLTATQEAQLAVGPSVRGSHLTQHRRRVLFTGLDPTDFRSLGNLAHWPALKLVRNEPGYGALPGVIERIKDRGFHWIVFTGKAAVNPFFNALEKAELDGRVLAGARIVASGSGTGPRLLERGICAEVLPSEPGARGIVQAMNPAERERALLVEGTHTPGGLEKMLAERGCVVERLALLRTTVHPELGRPLPEFDAIYFVSPSGVRAYWKTYGEAAFGGEIWCMGEAVMDEVRGLGKEGKVVDPFSA
jgi:uroporphyrinogen III methyltransferase/synthase